MLAWSSVFEPAGVSEDEAVRAVNAIYDVMIGSMRRRLGGA